MTDNQESLSPFLWNSHRDRLEVHSEWVAERLGMTSSNLLIGCYRERPGKPDAQSLYREAPARGRQHPVRKPLYVTKRLLQYLRGTNGFAKHRDAIDRVLGAFQEEFKRRKLDKLALEGEVIPPEAAETPDVEAAAEPEIIAPKAADDGDDAADDIEPRMMEGELRIRDIDLAKRLGFSRPVNIRKPIERHKASLLAFGRLSTVENGKFGGQAGDEFYLNRRQAIFITTKSETLKATDVTIEVIQKFDAYERGLIGQAALPAPAMSDDDVMARGYLIAQRRMIAAERAIETEWKPKVAELEMSNAAADEGRLQAEQIAERERMEKIAEKSRADGMAPKAEYFDELVQRNALYKYTEAAGMLKVQRAYLITVLLNPPLKWHFRHGHSGFGRLQPYETAIRAGYMGVQSMPFYNPKKGELDDKETARITEKGIEFLRVYLKKPFGLVG